MFARMTTIRTAFVFLTASFVTACPGADGRYAGGAPGSSAGIGSTLRDRNAGHLERRVQPLEGAVTSTFERLEVPTSAFTARLNHLAFAGH